MSSEKNDSTVIHVNALSMCFELYRKPIHRLLQTLCAGKKQYYKEFWALRDVSFEVKRGECIGIIGKNGAGKSTLLQILVGTLQPTCGNVDIKGRVAALLELGSGFNPEFTGKENVFMNAAILGLSTAEINSRYPEIVAFADIGDFIDQPVKTYSSGMYARLAFSIAIHADPGILIVDEALSVGDARFVAKCMHRIKDIQESGATILFVSHDVGSVRTLCQKAIWIDSGRIVEYGNVFPVTSRYMAYMFQDDSSPEELLREEIVESLAITQDETELSEVSPEVEAMPSEECSVCELDSRPVTHWGSHKGVIRGASVRGATGVRQDVIAWGEPVEIVIDVAVPPDISRDHLSVAFSIKDLKGTDLIVSATRDLERIRLPEQERFQVVFKLINPLVTGKYVLVAAVENRQHTDIHYYEYLEGAHYFSSLDEKRFFGLFQPAIQQIIRTE